MAVPTFSTYLHLAGTKRLEKDEAAVYDKLCRCDSATDVELATVAGLPLGRVKAALKTLVRSGRVAVAERRVRQARGIVQQRDRCRTVPYYSAVVIEGTREEAEEVMAQFWNGGWTIETDIQSSDPVRRKAMK